jgi:hypothetical protein
MMRLTKGQKKQFDEILEELGKTLDISETEYDAAVSSYMAVGRQLSKESSILAPYNPEILPQGSFLIGTMIKPVNEMDDLDIDLVCKLDNRKMDMSQYELKQKVGDQIKENGSYEKILENPDGRRCWTMRYRENSQDKSRMYHMDILPAIVDYGYKLILERAINLNDFKSNKLAIRITDKEHDYYHSEKSHLKWLKSNPFGYAIWFQTRATISNKIHFLSEGSIQSVPKFQTEKLPLQRIVQILKRHRDMIFSDEKHKEDKPISIIITTLAAMAYNGESGIIEGLTNVVNGMKNEIKEKYDDKLGKYIKWVGNPINDEENFADKWVDHPVRQKNFNTWLDKIEKDLVQTTQMRNLGLIEESLSKSFGSILVQKAFNNYGANQLKAREHNELKMATKTGMIGSQGRISIPQHQNFGTRE